MRCGLRDHEFGVARPHAIRLPARPRDRGLGPASGRLVSRSIEAVVSWTTRIAHGRPPPKRSPRPPPRSPRAAMTITSRSTYEDHGAHRPYRAAPGCLRHHPGVRGVRGRRRGRPAQRVRPARHRRSRDHGDRVGLRRRPRRRPRSAAPARRPGLPPPPRVARATAPTTSSRCWPRRRSRCRWSAGGWRSGRGSRSACSIRTRTTRRGRSV